MPTDAWRFAGHCVESMNETSHHAEALSSIPGRCFRLVSR
jgi:hypothetical protein